MSNKREWEIAEEKAKRYREAVTQLMTESAETICEQDYVEVSVLIPLTENINQEFDFFAPHEYMDADNTTLKKYFNEHICPIEELNIEDMDIGSVETSTETGVREHCYGEESCVEVNGVPLKIGQKLSDISESITESSDCLFKVGDKVIPISGSLKGEECTIKAITESGKYRVDWHGVMSVPYVESELTESVESYTESVKMEKAYNLTEEEVSIINEAIRKYEDEFPDIRYIIESTLNSKYRENIVEPEFFILEMGKILPATQVGKNNFAVWIFEGGNEGVNEPHVHIYYDGSDPSYKNGKTKKSKKVAYVSLNKAIYAPHIFKNNGTRILDKKELDDLVTYFNTLYKRKNSNTTCWEECVDRWINEFGDPNNVFIRDKNGDPVMPDYTKLNENMNNGNEDKEILTRANK